MPHPKTIDLTGKRFDRLLVLFRTGTKNSRPTWMCLCDCGNRADIFGHNLRYKRSRSCGCLSRERASETSKTHGMSQTPEYRIWASMRQRCSKTNNKHYHDYGGRGISVCKRWKSFKNFICDMGLRPSPEMSIDRINNDGNYEPSNCRWATVNEQARNKRNNVVINFQGKSLIMIDWAERIGLSKAALWARLNVHKWPIAKALTTPKIVCLS